MDRNELLDVVRASAAKVQGLEDTLQTIRDQEAALQEQRVKALEDLHVARDERVQAIRQAVDADIPKTQIATAAGMKRANLYVLLNKPDPE